MFGGPSSVAKSADEGQPRPGPWWTDKGIIPASWPLNFWQTGRNPIPVGEGSGVVEACVSSYAQSVAMCLGDHWRTNEDGGRTRVPAAQSALARKLRRPNDYQSTSDLLVNAIRSLYLRGNAYALGLRNARTEIDEIHLFNPDRSRPRIAQDGTIFYTLGGNPVLEQRLETLRLAPDFLAAVPARDVLHLRLHTPRHPLIGETPLAAAYMDEALLQAGAISSWRMNTNGSRPSGVIMTDRDLTRDQAEELRERWNEQSRGLAEGGVPILSSNLKFEPIGVSANDTRLVETMRLSAENIALAFRVPLAVIGLQGGQPMGSTEALMAHWIATGLGFCLNHIELALDAFFELPGYPEEYCELDMSALLRPNFRERIEGLARAVQSGVYAPNEARRLEGLPRVAHGDDPRVQQQAVPLSYGAALQPPTPGAPVPSTPPEPNSTDEPAETDDEEPNADERANFAQRILEAADRRRAA
jgi:HK97 family phage portal protein